ncbi:MAG TPA: BNR repeat-containing protein [Chitinophagaceae bacterium]|nr:BNR repeat-containing protein [Chitinophagaceae bacterium]
MKLTQSIVAIFFLLLTGSLYGQTGKPVLERVIPAGEGWAGNSVNTVVFRKNSLASLNGIQFISYYDAEGNVVLGKRVITDSSWELKRTRFKGKVTDAHRSISIALDGEGYLHMAWDHHGNHLRYCRSLQPFSLELSDEIPMTGQHESNVTYPEFYRMPDGGLLFFYRDGSSGNGNLIINTYQPAEKKWTVLQDNLISGEGKRNAYWQACVDNRGAIHISWVWRESPDVASNHDLCYAVSTDGGRTWEKSTGEKYTIPVTQSSAEIICSIPQRSELINQTSMYVDGKGKIVIASYWKGQGDLPQYQLVYHTGNQWKQADLAFRKTKFSLSGQGTKKIPVSRPQVIAWQRGRKTFAALIFRDEERGSVVSVVSAQLKKKMKWRISDLPGGSAGDWEPSYDTDLWKKENILHLFVQPVFQADAEGVVKSPPSLVKVLECHF